MKKFSFLSLAVACSAVFLTGCFAPKETPENNMAEAYHILLGYQGAPSASKEVPYETKEDALAQAQDLMEELNADMTLKNFQKLAQEYSTGPTGPDGGYLKSFPQGRMVPQFDTAVFSMDEPGLYPEPVETRFGYHLIFVKKLWYEEPVQ